MRAMRYRDASHVDVGSFYARRPRAGKVFRLLGHLGAASGACCAWRHDQCGLVAVLVAMLLLWLVAWYQVVGTLWRASIVAALALCAVALTIERWEECRAHCGPIVVDLGAERAP
jgi:hypothetical protein